MSKMKDYLHNLIDRVNSNTDYEVSLLDNGGVDLISSWNDDHNKHFDDYDKFVKWALEELNDD